MLDFEGGREAFCDRVFLPRLDADIECKRISGGAEVNAYLRTVERAAGADLHSMTSSEFNVFLPVFNGVWLYMATMKPKTYIGPLRTLTNVLPTTKLVPQL